MVAGKTESGAGSRQKPNHQEEDEENQMHQVASTTKVGGTKYVTRVEPRHWHCQNEPRAGTASTPKANRKAAASDLHTGDLQEPLSLWTLVSLSVLLGGAETLGNFLLGATC